MIIDRSAMIKLIMRVIMFKASTVHHLVLDTANSCERTTPWVSYWNRDPLTVCSSIPVLVLKEVASLSPMEPNHRMRDLIIILDKSHIVLRFLVF